MLHKQEEILKDLEILMEATRMEFPRLYFLSNQELVDLLGISRNPKYMQPTAKKCFPGIESLTFALPPGTSSISAELDFALNGNIDINNILFGVVPSELRHKNKSWDFQRLLVS